MGELASGDQRVDVVGALADLEHFSVVEGLHDPIFEKDSIASADFASESDH